MSSTRILVAAISKVQPAYLVAHQNLTERVIFADRVKVTASFLAAIPEVSVNIEQSCGTISIRLSNKVPTRL